MDFFKVIIIRFIEDFKILRHFPELSSTPIISDSIWPDKEIHMESIIVTIMRWDWLAHCCC